MGFGFKEFFYLFIALLVVFSSLFFKNKIRYFLVLLVVFFPFDIGIIFYRFHGIMIIDLPIVILLLVGILGQKNFKIFPPNVGLPVLLFFLWSLIGIFYARFSGYVISDGLRILRGFLIIVCLVNYIKTPKDLKAVMYGIFGVLAFQSILAIYQWRFGSIGLSILGETPYISWRSRGTFQHESYFGNYLAFMIPLMYRLFVFHKSYDKKEFMLYGFLFGASSLALFTAFTRGPWIAFVVATMAMTLWSFLQKRYKPKQMIPIFLIGIMGAVFLVRYIPSIFAQFDNSTGRQYSTKIRMPLNVIAFRVMKANPVSGIGLGNYLENNHKYVREDETMVEPWQIHQLKTDMVHNTFMLIGAETGFPGLFFFLWYIFATYRIGRKNIKSKITYLSNISIGMLTGFTALLIAFLASPDYRIHQINVLIWLIGGLIQAIHSLDKKYNKIISLKKKEHLLKSEPALLRN